MNKKTKIFLIITCLFPVLGVLNWPPDTMLLIYILFVSALLFRENLTRAVTKIRLSPSWKFLLLMILSGLVAETLAWTGNYFAREFQPALLHPQLIPDLILGIGFYSGWAIAWLIAHRFWRFSLLSVFIVTGFFGIWTEQTGAVLVNIAQNLFVNNFAAIYGALYIVLVYGSIVGLAYLPVVSGLNKLKSSNNIFKYPAVWILLFFTTNITSGIVLIIATFLKLIPEAKLIWEHPFF